LLPAFNRANGQIRQTLKARSNPVRGLSAGCRPSETPAVRPVEGEGLAESNLTMQDYLPRQRAICAALAAFALLLAFGGKPSVSEAGTLPANFQESTIFSGLSTPTVVRFASDGRVFVAEKSGVIKVFDSLSDTSPTVFADLNVNVDNFWDRGLLGMALDPSFPTRPYVYVLYTYDKDPASSVVPRWGTPGVYSDPCPNPPGATADGCVVSGRVTRLTASGNVSTGSEDVLITDWCQQYPSHSVGTLQFGPDGMLYVSGGDGASFNFVDYGQDGSPLNPCGDPPAGRGGNETPPTAEGGALRSQDLRTTADPTGLDGAILRIDPNTGAAPPDNPNSLSPDPNARRIIAYGTRNPFRFTIRPGTNELWVGDVGWNDWEEINRIPNPTVGVMNFGWPCYEGVGRQGGYDGANLNICEQLYAQSGAVTPPHYTYNHADKIVTGETCPAGGSSISGLAFYTGGNYPAAYAQALFYADYSRKCIWAMQKGTNGLPDPASIVTFDAGAGGPVHLEIGPNGDLFYADFDGGTVRRIRYFGANQPPNAVASATPTTGTAPLDVLFDGTGSSDPEGGPLTFAWDLDGDGAFDDSTAGRPTRTYAAGTYTVRLQVTDNAGSASVSLPLTITSNNTPPTATVSTPSPAFKWRVGDTISFSGSATDTQDGAIPPSGLSWKLTLQHCSVIDPTSCHTHVIQSFDGVASGSFSAPDHEYPSYLELTLTATDSGNLTDSKTVRLDPETVDLTFQSNPTGLQLAVGSASQATPFTRTVIIGSTNSLSAPSPQSLGAQNYQFTSWSDSGAQTHDVVAGATAATFTATYTATGQSSLVAAYGFDEGSGTVAADASERGNTGSVANATWVSTGRFGNALSFNGSSARVNVANSSSLQLSSGMTLEAWVRPASVSSVWRDVIYKADDNYYLEGTSDNGGRPGAGGTFGASPLYGPSVLPVNTWSHLAVTYDRVTLRLYVNGSQVASVARTGAIATSTNALQIGGDSIYGQYFNGLIDEVRIYNQALSAAAIQTDMNTPIGSPPTPDTTPPSAPANLVATPSIGRVALAWNASNDNVGVDHYNVHRSTTPNFTAAVSNRIAQPTGTSYADTGLAAATYYYRVTAADPAGNTSGSSTEVSAVVPADQPPSVSITAPTGGATVSGTVNVTASGSDDVGVAGVQFELDGAPLGAEDTSAPYSFPWLTNTASNGSHRLTAVVRDGAGHQTTSAPVNVTVDNPPAPPPSGLVAAYSFNTVSGSSVADVSGNNNGGTVVNAVPTVAGKYGGALSFNGTNARVNVANSASLQLSSGMTLEAWVNPGVVSSVWRDVIYKGDDNYYLEGTSDTGGRPGAGGTFGASPLYGPSVLPLNTWSHLAVTYDRVTLRLYVNGSQVASVARTAAIASSENPLQIGGDSIYGQYFQGLIDEVRIYNQALAAAAIQTDMNTALTP
jgi:glucose/arabinose dehydrogenase